MGKRTWNWLRRVAVVTLLGVLLFCGVFLYATRPSVLRARVTALFAELNLDVRHIGSITLSPFGGLQLNDLEVTARPDSPLALPAAPGAPPLLRMEHAAIAVKRWALLWGAFEPVSIRLDQPRVVLLRPNDSPLIEQREWDFDQFAERTARPSRLPLVRVEDADLQVYVIEDGRMRLLRHWVVDVDGAPRTGSDGDTGYTLTIEQVGGPMLVRGNAQLPLAEVAWDPRELRARLGWVDLELAQTLLPPRWQGIVERYALTGRVRAQELVLRPSGVERARLELRNARLCVPLEDPDADAPPFLDFKEIVGHFAFARDSSAAPNAYDVEADLTGKFRDAPARLTARAADVRIPAPRAAGAAASAQTGPFEFEIDVDAVEIPNAREHAAFVHAQRVPSPLRSWIRIYSAEGRMRIAARAWGAAFPSETGLEYEGTLEPLAGKCRIESFPYPIEDVYGTVHFSHNGITLENIRGRHRGGRIRCDGAVVGTQQWTGFDLKIHGWGIPTNAALYRALPEQDQRVWSAANPVGLWDATVNLSRTHGSPESGPLPVRVVVDGRLRGGSMTLRDHTTLQHANGRVQIADRRIQIERMHGFIDGARAQLNGDVTLTDDGASAYDFRLQMSNARFDRRSPVRDAAGNNIGEVRFVGAGDVWAQMSSSGDANPIRESYTVRINDGELTAFGEDAYWKHMYGWVVLDDGAPRIDALAGRSIGGWMGTSGVLPAALDAARPVKLHVFADDTDMARLLSQLIPGRWARIRQALNISGAGRLSAKLAPGLAADGTHEQIADLRIEAARMQADPIPLELEQVEAELELRPDAFTLKRMWAQYGDGGKITLSGNGSWAGSTPWTSMQAHAENIDLTPKFINAMPERLASLLRSMSPSGRIQTTIDQLHLTGAAQDEWIVAGRVALRDAALRIGLPLTGFKGEVWGECEQLPDQRVSIDARFVIEDGTFAGRAIRNCEGFIQRDPASSKLVLGDIRGELCDGNADGSVKIDVDARTYDTAFSFHDLDLRAAFPPRDQDKPQRGGRLDGRLFVRGSLDDPTQRRGGGELRIRSASLLSSPVTAKVAEATPQQINRDELVDQALVTFAWRGDVLLFESVDIRAGGLRLIGSGSWNTRSDAIDLTLLGAFGEDTPRIPALTDLIEAAGQELTQYRVTGTVAKPNVTVEPLHNLTDPFRRLGGR